MILYGGQTSGDMLYGGTLASADVWAIQLTPNGSGLYPYGRITTTGPSPGQRAGHVAFYDPRYQRMMVFAGRGAQDNDVYALQLSGPAAGTWSKPWLIWKVRRQQASATFDPYLEECVLWGGRDPLSTNPDWELTDSHIYLIRDWTDPNTLASDFQSTIPGAGPPRMRIGASAIFDPCAVHPAMIVFGGWERYEATPGQGLVEVIGVNDVWALTLLENPSYFRWDNVASCPAVPGVTDFAVDGVGRSDVRLVWHGVPDQPTYGSALTYEVRRSTSPIYEDNFSWGTLIGQFPHTGAGDPYCLEARNLGCTAYYFAIRVQYESGARALTVTSPVSPRCSGDIGVPCPEPAPSAPAGAESSPADLALSAMPSAAASGARSIAYSIPKRLGGVPFELALYDVGGRRTRTLDRGPATAGWHRFVADLHAGGQRLPKGVYFLRIRVGSESRSRTILLLD